MRAGEKKNIINLSKSGRIEKFIGNRFKTSYDINPIKILLWVIVIAYVPILIGSAIDGSLFRGNVDVPFLLDYKSQFRALIAIPLLIIGRKAVKEKVEHTCTYVADKLLDDDQFKTVFAPAIDKLERFNEKGFDELIIVVVLIAHSFVLGFHNIAILSDAANLSGWYGHVADGELQMSTLAKWHLFISMSIYRFIIVRWIWMYGCWVWLLYKISKCKLKLSLYHADKMCGLSLLMVPQRAFNVFFVAIAIIDSGDLINQITYFHQSFELVKIEIVAVMAASFIFLLAPYLLFTGMLLQAKNKAEMAMGRKSMELSNSFQTHFVDQEETEERDKVDSSVISDFDAVYSLVMNIKPVPFTLRDIIALAIPIALAFLPTLLTFMTVQELFNIILGFVT